MYAKHHSPHQLRVKLTESMLKNFFKNIFQGKVSELSVNKRLSYTLVYNLVHGRIRSLSARDYKIIFGEDPPLDEVERVDGDYFRRMVKLWLFLNDDVTEAELYREFYPRKEFKRVDYRIFNGDVKTIPIRLEKCMENKFLDQGFDLHEIKQYCEELDLTYYDDRVNYEEIKPILGYLEKNLDIHPGRILKQFPARYESGELLTIPQRVYDDAKRLKIKTEWALKEGSRYELEKLREEIYGKRTALTLFSAVEDELEFLKNNGGRRPKHYLGRSINLYKKSKLKRIASWRVRKIREDCVKLIRQRPEIPISFIPRSYLLMVLKKLFSVLTIRMISKMSDDRNGKLERSVLEPTYPDQEDFGPDEEDTISMDRAAQILGMSKKAFDLMVASHRDIFRDIVIYEKKWYVPTLYLKGLLKKDGFFMIKTKYEFLAKNGSNAFRPTENQSRHFSRQ